MRTDHGKFNPQIAAIEDPSPKTIKIGTAKIRSKMENNIAVRNK
tara:strand:+ start:1194 stop:1325 length:132 start_codon:yes stop_codon:yes gene_type:complete